jgi:hypothetical protein
MFVNLFVMSLRDVARASRPRPLAVLAIAWLARLHAFVAPASVQAQQSANHSGARPYGAGQLALKLVRRAAQMAARTAYRVAHVGNPLTPGGYLILALTVVAIVLVAVLSSSSAANELDHALRLSWWFA